MLTEVAVKQAKPREKKYRLYDQGGLYLEITPTGRKYWRYKFRVRQGDVRKEKRLALGVYPDVGLKQARLAHARAKLQVANGDDPTTIKRLEETAKALEADHFFGDIARDWFETQSPTWSASHTVRQTRLLFKDLAALHPLPIKSVLAPELLRVLRVIEARGAIESARRA
ncbi:MAG: Arm DNA-binding domain-containing protein, partial [Pseudomonadota bacterium]|nr:Arm DNA-binding domain-containing protein [Pseudomonadota bacterium]